MSANVTNQDYKSKTNRFDRPRKVVRHAKKRAQFDDHRSLRTARDEEEALVTKVVLWFAILAVTPLILFLILQYFHPELFMIPITPE